MIPLYFRLFLEAWLNSQSMLIAALRKLLEEDKRLRGETQTQPVTNYVRSGDN